MPAIGPISDEISTDSNFINGIKTDSDFNLKDTPLARNPSFPKSSDKFFTENLGQWQDHILFSAKSPFGSIALGTDCVYYNVILEDSNHIVKVSFQNGLKASPEGQNEAGFDSNFLFGNNPEKWVRGSRSFEKVIYENVWPEIDIVYYFKEGNLKYDIILGEYADADVMAFKIEGHENLKIEKEDLVMSLSDDISITDSDLIAYYDDGTSEAVNFEKINDNLYGFDIDKIEGKILTIDPLVLSRSTFFGGSYLDHAKDMEFDPSGNLIILAETLSLDFPNTTGAYQQANAGSGDIVISKMDHNATSLIFSTYIGGWSYDFPSALDVDSNHDIYATGETWSTNFPTTSGVFSENSPAGSTNVFVLKLNSAGSNLIYSTYVGSTSADWAEDIQVFGGEAYVVGYSYSYDFPYVDEPINNAHGSTFFFILNHNASNLTHTAFWGGFQNEMAYTLDIVLNGDVVVGGITNSMDFPVTSGVYQESVSDWNNGFLLKYRPSTSELLFSTYIGGSALDEIRSVHLDASNDIYFAGITNNPDGSGDVSFPTTPGAYDRTYNGSKDIFIAKMSGDGTTLIYSTLYGSEGVETVGSIDLDSQGNVYFIGTTDSDVNFTVTSDAFDRTHNKDNDVLFAKISADCSRIIYSTYLGGNLSDLGKTCLLFGTNEIYLYGNTDSLDFPVTSGAYQSQNKGADLFITKFELGNYIFLHEGWNMISVPLVPDDPSFTGVLSSISGHYDAIRWYEGSSGSWIDTHIHKPSIMNEMSEITIHMGFWIHITTPGGVLHSL
jgi:hypothetical protein